MEKRKALTSVFACLIIFTLLLSIPGASAMADRDDLVHFDASGNIVNVSTVDELLAAIAPDTTIKLSRGIYNLSKATDYGTGSSEYYHWDEVYDGYELVITGANGLSIFTEDDDDTVICAVPRYANVFRFENMAGLNLGNMTMGHTEEPGACSGGVLLFEGVDDTVISDCKLYGCGIIGIDAHNCDRLFVYDSEIYDCSFGAIAADRCFDVRVYDSDIYRCEGWALFDVSGTTGFAIVNCDIDKNSVGCMLSASYSPETYLLGCDLEENNFFQSMFLVAGETPVIESSDLHRNNFTAWYDSVQSPTPGMRCVDRNGNDITNNQLESMRQSDCRYDGPIVKESKVTLDFSMREDGIKAVKVKTADEFVAAIGPKTNIMLEGDMIDLSSVSDYGSGEYYYWEVCFDGPQLVIKNADDLSITSEIMTTLTAAPRYANVLSFQNCKNLWLSGFIAGHTEAPGSCTGGVLYFENCENVAVDGCSLYGCGILGITANYVDGLSVVHTEIYDCSEGAARLWDVKNASFVGCDIHDCAMPEIGIDASESVSFESDSGKRVEISNGYYTPDADGMPLEWDWEKGCAVGA